MADSSPTMPGARETSPITSRLKTGVPGLDELLGGGLLAGRSALLKGAPGSGKTTLGLQMLVAGAARFDDPGILLTFEQLPQHLYADARGFGWDLEALVEAKRLQILFVRPQEILEEPGRQENRLLATIDDWVTETGARRILIDSISHLRPLYTGEQARALFLNFVLSLKAMGLTPIMTAELMRDDGAADLDAYLVDTVVQLTYEAGGGRRSARRGLSILKTRGHGHVGGAHPFEFDDHGIVVYPHCYPSGDEGADAVAGADFLPSGIPGMDALLGGGFTPGSNILVAGLSGTFKTTVAAHFLMAGVQAATPGLWISTQERVDDLMRACAKMGMGPGMGAARECGRLAFLECTPGLEPIEKIARAAERAIDEQGVRRVVVDSMSDLVFGVEDEEARQEATLWLLRRLRARGATTLYTERLARAAGRNPLSEIEWAEMADTIVYLGLVEIESRLEKVVSVLKHRGALAEGDLRSIYHTPKGLEVSERFIGLSGVLAGTPLGKRKAQIENVFQPLYFIRDFLYLAKDPALAQARREQVLQNVSGQAEKLIALLGQYFDEPVRPDRGAKGKET